MTRPVDVRRVGSGELEEVLGLWTQAREEAVAASRPAVAPTGQVSEKMVRAVAEAEIVVLLARWDGRPAGYAVLRPAALTPWHDSPALNLEYLYVAAGLRRLGVARALLMAVTGIAERHGIDQVVSHVPPTARDMHRFYARLGFAPMLVRRAVATGALRRRLSGESVRPTLEDLLSRRRSLRDRAHRLAGPATLELPVIPDGARPA